MGASRAGMIWEQTRTEVIADNMANLNTDGYRRKVAVGTEFGDILLRRLGDKRTDGPRVGSIGSGAVVDQIITDQRRPSLLVTERSLDAALVGAGAFTYQTATGPAYTRDGRFQRDVTGQLVTAKGELVLVNGAPIGQGATSLEIGPNGVVMVDGQPAGRLDIQGGTAETVIQAGALEASNVDLIQEMTDLTT
ncbi:MAG TPA: flagellar hook-basal body complex protein, partial [Symbiobacteriaceae bacterium]|nr:flagellar hook-basal body complex protein [Symbiobacteriaceae bacterium]